jgi:hypothetical protein
MDAELIAEAIVERLRPARCEFSDRRSSDR